MYTLPKSSLNDCFSLTNGIVNKECIQSNQKVFVLTGEEVGGLAYRSGSDEKVLLASVHSDYLDILIYEKSLAASGSTNCILNLFTRLAV